MLLKKMKQRIREYCAKTYPQSLEVVVCDENRPLFNRACHYNADALVKQGKAVAVIECVMLYDDSVTLHYVNLRKDLKVFDGTLGPLWAKVDYRLIEVFGPAHIEEPYDRLLTVKRQIAKAAGVPKWAIWHYGIHELL